MFWNNKKNDNLLQNPINSREYGECLKRIAELNTDISTLRSKVESLSLGLDNLRGNFSRKLKGIQQEETKVEEQKDINTSNDVYFG